MRFVPVAADTWPDFEELFAAKGGPSYCWCMPFRAVGDETKKTGRADRKKQMKLRVLDDVPVGLLGYQDDAPVAWVSVAPKPTFKRLGGEDADDERVWSITCMFVPRTRRGAGSTTELIEAAIAHAKKRGARVLEAYPVDDDSPSYRFMGRRRFFDALGFEHVGRAGTRRHVMRLTLKGRR